jgi:diacylglycerol kinase (ATP)
VTLPETRRAEPVAARVRPVRGLLMITNSEAGDAGGAEVDAAVDVLTRSYDVEVIETADRAEVADVLSRRCDRDVTVVGGDGSLHTVVQVLHSTGDLEGTRVGVIPRGTGNDFARALDLPFDSSAAAEVIASGHLRRVDLLIDSTGAVVVNAVHAGIGADAGRAARPFKWLGRAGYVVGAVLVGLVAKGHRIRVVADGDVLADGTRRVLQVGIGNGAHIGGGVELTPDADPADGLADVVVSFAVRPLDRLLYGLRLRRGTHEERHDVQVTRAVTVRLSGAGLWFNADGELEGPLDSRTWTVLPSVLSVFCQEER